MKKIAVFSLSVCVMLFSSAVYADLLTGGVTSRGTDFIFQYINPPANSSPSGWNFASPMEGENLTSGELMNLFCVDMHTYVTSDFVDPSIGQSYDAVLLSSSTMTLYSDFQKAALNSLFSYVYTSILDDANNMLYTAATMAFQLTVWEIIHEDSGDWNIASGNFGITGAAMSQTPGGTRYINDSLYNEIVSLTDHWFAAFADESLWGPNYARTDIPLYVYVAEGGTHVSQTLLSVTPPAVPEPATMLIFGLGTLALPFARRLRKKEPVV